MLSADRLRLGYGNHVVVKDISVSIEYGTMNCIIGPNGCGKSTLLRGLSGLLAPLQGAITLDDKPLNAWPARQRAQRLAVLLQNPIAPDGISVEQLVQHGRYPHQGIFQRPRAEDHEAVEWALAITGMHRYRRRPFHALSGGERQRGWIALALAQQADVLLVDEPTTFLDIGRQLEIMDLLRQLNRDHGTTVVMVLHDINQASRYADRLLAMQSGALIADGAPVEVIHPELLMQLFDLETERVMRDEDGRAYPYCMPVRAQRTPHHHASTPRPVAPG
jgi:iron complex transport system ATP-binding protein